MIVESFERLFFNILLHFSVLNMTVVLSDIPVLERSNVRMKNVNSVVDKINRIISRKKENLQVITDYDFTLTKQHVNGQTGPSSFGLLCQWDKLPEGFMDKDMEIKSKYYPIEVDLSMTVEEKIPHMMEWYQMCQDLWRGVRVEMEGLRELIARRGPELRDGTVELCKLLGKEEIPVLVLSAGLGDVIAEVMRHHGLVESDYFHIISNFFVMKDGVVDGYGCKENGTFIHPFNKNGTGCSEYFKKLGNRRSSVILMGDSLGDAGMDQGVPEVDTVLKIGFVYGTPAKIEQCLGKYMDHFDIVLIDDQTMDVTRAIIDLVLCAS